MSHIAVLMACHNRREKTLAALRGLFACSIPKGVFLTTFLVDDGSTDGTREVVAKEFPQIRLLSGDGSLYWGGATRLAFLTAMQEKCYDYYLWLNDDTLLYSDALEGLLLAHDTVTSGTGSEALIVGSTRDEHTGVATYGGQVRVHRLFPMRHRLVTPGDLPLACDTVNGNCVLISDVIARAVGNIDTAFVHTMGDFDYAMRARKHGFQVRVMPGFAGTCSHNPAEAGYRDSTLTLKDRWRKLLSTKGLPPRAWGQLTRRYAGRLWVVHWAWPYVKFLWRASAGYWIRKCFRLPARNASDSQIKRT